MPLPKPTPQMAITLYALATSVWKVLRNTVGDHTPFDVKCDGGVYKDVQPLSWTEEAEAALKVLCERLAFAPYRSSPADPEAAASYKADIAAVWERNPSLSCAIGCPENPFLGESPEGASVSTWARYGNDLNVHSLKAFRLATPTAAFFQTAHAVMKRKAINLRTLSLTICISLCAFGMLGMTLALRQFDGQCLSDLTEETKAEGTDGQIHLDPPSDLGIFECYEALFRKLLDGRCAFLFVDGAKGRKMILQYIVKHKGHASPLSGDTLIGLNQDHCDFEQDMVSTNAGSIFLLFIHGSMMLVFLRPSTGSWFFELSRQEGPHGAGRALQIVQNQMWLLSIFMGLTTVSVFRTGSSTLLAMMQTVNQAAVTAFLHARGWLACDVQFITPSSLGGKMTYTLKTGIFDPAHAAAVAAGRKDRTSGASAAAVNSEVLLVFRYRPNPSLEYGEWRGARFLYSDDHAGSLDGITRTMLATELGASASQQDADERVASKYSILPLFTVEHVRNATQDIPHEFLDGHVQVALATPPPSAQRLGVAPKVVLERRYRTPAPAPAKGPCKRATPASSLAAAPPPKTSGAGPPRGPAAAENVPPQNNKPEANTPKPKRKPPAKKKGSGWKAVVSL